MDLFGKVKQETGLDLSILLTVRNLECYTENSVDSLTMTYKWL